MKLAIVITTYDNLPMLKILVKQVYKYTKDFNLYIVDDGQRKETIKYLQSLSKHKNYSYLIHGKNMGIAASWNDGLRMAEKDGCTHFAVFNDDIELCEDWWEKCRIKFADNNHLVSLDQPCPIPVITGWFFIIDKVTINKIGYFDEEFRGFCSEDYDYALRYKASGLNYAKVDIPVIHKNGGSNTLGKIRKEKPEYYKEVWNNNWMRLRKKHPNVRIQDQTML